MKEEKEYPCKECEEEDICESLEIYVVCKRWREWFRRRWREIRKLFGHDVSDCHDEEEGDED